MQIKSYRWTPMLDVASTDYAQGWPNPRQYTCFRAHRDIWSRLKPDMLPALVLEHDAIFAVGGVNGTMDRLPKCDVAYLGGQWSHAPARVYRTGWARLPDAVPFYRTHAYVIASTLALVRLMTMRPAGPAWSHETGWRTGLRVMVAVPPLAGQRAGWSVVDQVEYTEDRWWAP